MRVYFQTPEGQKGNSGSTPTTLLKFRFNTNNALASRGDQLLQVGFSKYCSPAIFTVIVDVGNEDGIASRDFRLDDVRSKSDRISGTQLLPRK